MKLEPLLQLHGAEPNHEPIASSSTKKSVEKREVREDLLACLRAHSSSMYSQQTIIIWHEKNEATEHREASTRQHYYRGHGGLLRWLFIPKAKLTNVV